MWLLNNCYPKIIINYINQNNFKYGIWRFVFMDKDILIYDINIISIKLFETTNERRIKMFGLNFGGRKPDRIERNRSDGQTFFGYDHDDGTTDWYTKDGILDSSSKTPNDEDDE